MHLHTNRDQSWRLLVPKPNKRKMSGCDISNKRHNNKKKRNKHVSQSH